MNGTDMAAFAAADCIRLRWGNKLIVAAADRDRIICEVERLLGRNLTPPERSQFITRDEAVQS